MANETRLIDANATIDAFTNWLTSRYDGRLPRDIVAEIPTVDAVEVTRCKGCQEFAPGFIRPYLGWCSVWDTTVRETGFCHHGKPRSEEKPKPAWPPQEEMEEPCED